MKTVIAISRQKGAGGRATAEIVAGKLGWPVISRDVVAKAARKAGVDDEKIQMIFEHRPSLQDRMTIQQRLSKYLDAITHVINEYADTGNIVFLGRGAGVILRDDPRLFRVHLVADLETRIERIAAKGKFREKRKLEEARRAVVDSDYARTAFFNYLFNIDWNNPLNYDMVLNTTDLTPEQAAVIVIAAFEVEKE